MARADLFAVIDGVPVRLNGRTPREVRIDLAVLQSCWREQLPATLDDPARLELLRRRVVEAWRSTGLRP